MKTWQTTVLGIVFLVGSTIQLLPGPAWLHWVGGVLAALGGGGGFMTAARDTKQTREHVEGLIRSARAA